MAPSDAVSFFFSCSECPRVFFSKPSLLSHIKAHRAEALLALVRQKVPCIPIHDIGYRIKKSCPTCGLDIVLSAYNTHLKSHRIKGGTVSNRNCPKRNYTAPTADHYWKHLQVQNSDITGNHRCLYCEAVFSKKISLHIHASRKHPKPKKNTLKRLSKGRRSRRNTARSKVDPFPKMPELEVNEIDYNSSSNSQTEPPELDVEGETNYRVSEDNGVTEETCQTCGESISVSVLLDHVASHLESGQGVCTLCEYKAGNKQDLVDHLSTHYNIKAYVCTYCDKKYHWKHSLTRHFVNSHSAGAGKSKPHQCGLCGQIFSSTKEERRHALTHIAEQERHPVNRYYEDSVAGDNSMDFNGESPEIGSNGDKTNPRPFQCKICGKGFMKKKQCKAHEAIHNKNGSKIIGHNSRNAGANVFNKPKRKKNNSSNFEVDTDMTMRSCKSCGEEMLLADLLIHIKNHITKEQRQCDLCKHVYANVESLREHMHTHYGLEPHKCMICGKTYSLKQSVLNHIIRNHKAAKPLEYYSCTIPPSPKPVKEFSSAIKEKYKQIKNISPSLSPTPPASPVKAPVFSQTVSSQGISCFASGIKTQQLRFHSPSPSPSPVTVFGNSSGGSRFHHGVTEPVQQKKPPRPINFQCNFCQRVFTTKFSVQRHEAKLHNYIDTDNKRVYKTTYAPEDSDTNGMESQSSESSDNPHFNQQWNFENGFRNNLPDSLSGNNGSNSGEVLTNDNGIPYKSESLQSEIRGLLLFEQEFMAAEVVVREIPTELY